MKKAADNCSGGDHYFLATSWLDNRSAEDKYLFHLNQQKVVSCVYLFLPASNPAVALCARRSTKGICVRLDSRGLISDEVVFDDATLETKPVVSTA